MTQSNLRYESTSLLTYQNLVVIPLHQVHDRGEPSQHHGRGKACHHETLGLEPEDVIDQRYTWVILVQLPNNDEAGK